MLFSRFMNKPPRSSAAAACAAARKAHYASEPRRGHVLLLGRRGAALVYAVAALLTPASIAVAVAAGGLPMPCLAAVAPSLLLIVPLRWVVGDTSRPVPVGALAANVAWNLLTNATLAGALAVASAF
jgi:hypothetical protein